MFLFEARYRSITAVILPGLEADICYEMTVRKKYVANID